MRLRGLGRLSGGRDWFLPTGGRAGSCVSGGQGHFRGCVEWVTVYSGRLHATCMLIGAAVFLSCWLAGLRHPSIGAHRLLDGAPSW